MARKCPYCGSTKITLNPERLWVCAECATVIRPLYVMPQPKHPRQIQRPQ